MGDPLPVVLIPAHHAPETEGERIALRALNNHLGRYPRVLIGPREAYDWEDLFDATYHETPDDYWNVPPDGRRGYSPLMLAPGLYEQLRDFTHVLVYQLDAVVFRDELEAFCAQPYDYIGAPHSDMEGDFSGVGNGGLSLRRIEACLGILEGMAPWPEIESYYRHVGMNEDLFWSFEAPRMRRGFTVATVEEGLRFSWEADPALCWLLTRHKLPMGAHGWERHSPEFWQNLGGVAALSGYSGFGSEAGTG